MSEGDINTRLGVPLLTITPRDNAPLSQTVRSSNAYKSLIFNDLDTLQRRTGGLRALRTTLPSNRLRLLSGRGVLRARNPRSVSLSHSFALRTDVAYRTSKNSGSIQNRNFLRPTLRPSTHSSRSCLRQSSPADGLKSGTIGSVPPIFLEEGTALLSCEMLFGLTVRHFTIRSTKTYGSGLPFS